MKKIFMVTKVLLVHLCLLAQNQETIDPDKKTDWWDDIDGFMNQQAKITLGLVNDALKINPPAIQESLMRKMALTMIDNVMHDEKAAYRPAVQQFFQVHIGNAVEEIKNEKVVEGAVIWKLYNHSFVIKTPSITIGFDIQRGLKSVEGFTISRELIKTLVDVVDILLITHIHGDHADELVAEMFLTQNKPVVTPADIFTGSSIYQRILHPQRKSHEIQEIYLPEKGFSIKAVVYPGHQGEKILNNVYLVFSPEGLAFSHTGDQSNLNDFEWIDRIGDNFKVDVVMTNSWATYPELRLAHGYRSKLIIAGHENEMGHTIDHREPFWLNYNRLGDKTLFPWIQMVMGEKFHYISRKE